MGTQHASIDKTNLVNIYKLYPSEHQDKYKDTQDISVGVVHSTSSMSKIALKTVSSPLDSRKPSLKVIYSIIRRKQVALS